MGRLLSVVALVAVFASLATSAQGDPPKTFACGAGHCTTSQLCCSDPTHAPSCVAPANAPDWCMMPAALRGTCDPKSGAPCAAGEKCCSQRRPIPRTANPVCLAHPAPDDCAN